MKKNAGKIAIVLGMTNYPSYKLGQYNAHRNDPNDPINQVIGFTNATHS
jgi:hypothetical protein